MYWVIEACPNAVRLACLVYIADTQLLSYTLLKEYAAASGN